MMEVNLDSIYINQRKRKLNAEKVDALAESFSLLGQLEPITLALSGEKYTLLAGRHRLEAAKLLGWETIDAELFQGDELECELVEIDENLMNNELTVLEQGEHIQRRNEILEAMGKRAKASPGINQYSEVGEMVSSTKTTEDIAKEAGLSKRSAQQRTQIARDILPEVKELIRDTQVADSTTQLLELARLKPDEQIAVAKQSVDGEMTVSEAKRKLNREKKVEAILENTIEPVENAGLGKFPVIYADPPWRYEFSKSPSRDIENQYPTMTFEEICNLDVGSVANDDCTLFLWTTSPKLEEALQVIEAWGFEYKTNAVWVKDKIGMGYYFRQQHELLLVATKGNLPMCDPSDRVSSVIEAPRDEHSKKPEVVYEIIEQMYPEYRKLELFARNKRDGWKSWGNQL